MAEPTPAPVGTTTVSIANFSASLAACSGIDVVGILRKQRQEVTHIDIRVTGAQQPDPPWVWETVHIQFAVRGKGLSRPAAERAVDLSLNKYCSVVATIADRTSVTSELQIIEEGDSLVERDT